MEDDKLKKELEECEEILLAVNIYCLMTDGFFAPDKHFTKLEKMHGDRTREVLQQHYQETTRSIQIIREKNCRMRASSRRQPHGAVAFSIDP